VVALWLKVTWERPLLIALIVVPEGMPVPETPEPTASPVVFRTATVVDPVVTVLSSEMFGVPGGGPVGAVRAIVVVSV
jgi:hypothetical protein